MTSDYEKALGVWHHKIGEIEHVLHDREGDNLQIARIMKSAQKNGIDWLYQEFNKLYVAMVLRENALGEDEQKLLKRWVEKNQVQIQKDLLVWFGWQTKEQQERLEGLGGDDLKKLISA